MRFFSSIQEIYSRVPCMQQDNTNVFLLLDGGFNKGTLLSTVYQKEPCPDLVPLFLGTIHEKNLQLGPQLINVKQDSLLLQWFIDEGLDSGIMLFSNVTTDILAKHFRHFIECILPDDKHKMFRFYDPMIFYYFYPSLTLGEQRLFMGSAIGAACASPLCAPDGDSLLINLAPIKEDYATLVEYKEEPWFVSEVSYAALNTPAQYSLAKVLAKDFKKTYPRIARILGQKRILLFTQNIVSRNEIFGLSDIADLRIFMGYIAQLGVDFDKDTQYYQIALTFQNNNPPRQQLKDMGAALEKLNKFTWGAHGKPYYMAFKRYLQTSYEDLSKISSGEEIIAHLKLLYPEKAAYVGDTALAKITAMATVKAQEWGLLPRPGVALCTGILLFLGCGCKNDPIRPWVSDYINTNISPQEKTKKLFEISKRIVKLNFKERVLAPEQENALFVYNMLKPIESLRIAIFPRPAAGSSLVDFLCVIHPEMKNGAGYQWANNLIEQLDYSLVDKLAIQVQALLVLGYMVQDLAEVSFTPNLELLQSYCEKNQQENAIYMLEAELHGIVRQVRQDIYTQHGGDIL